MGSARKVFFARVMFAGGAVDSPSTISTALLRQCLRLAYVSTTVLPENILLAKKKKQFYAPDT